MATFCLRLRHCFRRNSNENWTLRFSDPGLERGFLQQHADQFTANMSFFLIIMSCAFALSWILPLLGLDNGPFSGSCNVPKLASPLHLASFGFFSLLALGLLLLLKVPYFQRKTRPIHREHLAAQVLCILTVGVQVFYPFYLAKLLGGSLHGGCSLRRINCPETFTLLLLINMIATAHLTVPIRWCNLLPLEVLAVIIQAFHAFVLGGTETFDRAVVNFLFLCTLIFMMAVGKRNTERIERKLFTRLMSEKILRTQAEFQLARLQTSRTDEAGGEDGQTVTDQSTTITEQAFLELQQEGLWHSHQQLETLAAIGKREQWLIDAKEVCIMSDNTLLGCGGFGMVMRGTFHGTPIAVKAPFRFVKNELSLADIGNELRILRRLRHPHVVLCHGAVIESSRGEVALVLELLRGQSMIDFVSGNGNEGRRPTSDAQCQCLLGICRALLYLHTCTPKIVHGDIKASNIIIQHLRGSVDEQEVVHAKLLDFGLARVLTRHAKSLGGTTRWRAPELFSVPAIMPSRAADVYSFGCLLFYIVSGQQPMEQLENDTIEALRRRGTQISLQWPPNSRALGQSQTMVDQTTVMNPEARPSMKQIHDELVQWPEIRQAHAHVCDAIHDTVDEAGMASNVPRQHFWQQLQQARSEILAQDPTCAWHPRMRQSPQDGPDFQLPSLRRPHAVEETARQGAARGDSQLRYADLAETHVQLLNMRVLGTIKRCNFRFSHATCCIHHAAMEALGNAHAALAMQSCQQTLVADRNQLVFQCPQCTMIEQARNITEADDFECMTCGFCGKPTVRGVVEGSEKPDTQLSRGQTSFDRSQTTSL